MDSGYDHEDDEDFEEEVVWDVVVVRERRDVSPKPKNACKDLSTAVATSSSYPSSSSSSTTTSARMIPRNTTTTCSSSSTAGAARQSAPVNIPDWSKIYQLNKINHPSAHGHDDDESCNNGGLVEEGDDDGSEGGDLEEEEEGKVPPHEWLAKKMARARISSFSVCEGAGRTLKGRDLSKVRNAVLTRTGFLE